MLCRLALALCTLAPVVAARAQGAWEPLPGSPSGGSRYDDIELVTPDTLYLAGRIGGMPALYRSSDGGTTWTPFDHALNARPRSLAFVSGTHGFLGVLGAGAPAPSLYETTDGGVTLTPVDDRITGPLPDGVCGLFALDSLAVYGVGAITGRAHFLRTLDAGQTWTSLDLTAQAAFLIDVHFFDRQHGLAVGGTAVGGDHDVNQPIVLGTDDGGATWTERYVGAQTGAWGWKLSFPTPQTGYVAIQRIEELGGDGYVLRTNDAGMSWAELTVPGVVSMQGIGFITPEQGWLGGHGPGATTADGGATWTPFSPLGTVVNRIVFSGDSLGFASGDRVYRYRTHTTPTALPPAPALAFAAGPAYPNPFPRRVLLPFTLPAPAEVSLDVFIDYGRRGAGQDELLWEGTDDAGRPLAAGVYVYRLRAGALEATGRFVKAAPAY